MPVAPPRARPVRSSTRLILAVVLLTVVALSLAWVAFRATDSSGGNASTGSSSAVSTPTSAKTPAQGPAQSPAKTPASGLATIAESALPKEARATLALIRKDGPYPYSQDGVTFQNRERILPAKAKGYYREFTVRTPGSPDRGPRRIIAGRDGDLYWTADHYASFEQIVEGS